MYPLMHQICGKLHYAILRKEQELYLQEHILDFVSKLLAKILNGIHDEEALSHFSLNFTTINIV